MIESKVCRKCKQEKDIFKFGFHAKTKDGYRHECNECRVKLELLHRDERRDRKYQYNFGITLGHYELMLKTQNGVCAICGQPETQIKGSKIQELSVDHQKQPFKVRALLCDMCNRGLGHFKDDPELLEKAAQYLRRHGRGKK